MSMPPEPTEAYLWAIMANQETNEVIGESTPWATEPGVFLDEVVIATVEQIDELTIKVEDVETEVVATATKVEVVEAEVDANKSKIEDLEKRVK